MLKFIKNVASFSAYVVKDLTVKKGRWESIFHNEFIQVEKRSDPSQFYGVVFRIKHYSMIDEWMSIHSLTEVKLLQQALENIGEHVKYAANNPSEYPSSQS
jgi:hypothetical protein